MSNFFGISDKPEIAAAVVKIDANKTVIDENKVILADLHDTDLPAINTKLTTLDTVADNIRNIDVPNIQTNINTNETKIDANKTVIDNILSTINYVYPSDDVLHTNASEQGLASLVYGKLKETFVNVDGIIRISFDLRTPDVVTCYGKIYINGVAVGIERSQSDNGWQTYTEDLLILRGDAIQIYVMHTDVGRWTYVQNLVLKGVLSTSFEIIS